MRNTPLLIVLAPLLASCTGSEHDAALAPALIVDEVHNSGTEGFFWLPPMVAQPTFDGVFDEALSPVVEIDELGGANVATFTTESGPGSETVRVVPQDQLYVVNWHTDAFALDVGTTYRIKVRDSGQLHTEALGIADVDLVASGGELRNVNTGEYIPLLDGRTLPIKFRIEHGARGACLAGYADCDGSATNGCEATLVCDACPVSGVGVVGRWLFDEVSGSTVFDDSGLANDGTATGTNVVAGLHGNARYFDGASFITVPDDDSLDFAGDFSIALWAKTDGNVSPEGKLVLKFQAFGSVGYEMEIQGPASDGRPIVEVHTSSGVNFVRKEQNVADDQWHCWVAVRQCGALRFYIDGLLAGTDADAAGDVSNGGNLTFGRRELAGDQYYRGALDDVTLYDRALSGPEIADVCAP